MADGDDRQFPERVFLKRPDHLVQRLYEEHLENSKLADTVDTLSMKVSDIPVLIQGRPLLIHDVVLSKLHSAILTADPVSNLYMCGIGRGGRLGFGDENTRFSFEPVQGPLTDKKIIQIALGQNHSMAVTDNGELWTWGSNAFSQLGYTLPPSPRRDEDPMTATPRQVFGPLRKEHILGVAASALHSVAHTGSSLYCWGKNVGQLALMDADSRSLDIQAVPRKVAASLFSSPIVAVSAIDKATTCLLANHTVCVFTSYGYNIVKFPFGETFGNHPRLGNFSMSSRYDAGRSQINSIASGGETIAAITSRGDLFTMSLTNMSEGNQSATSTTNTSKIRGALTTPKCIWNAHKDGVRSVGVGEQGSVIISTHSGAVWRRIKRAKAKDAHVSGVGARSDPKKKDYKFQRVPCITNVATVRSSTFGAFAAIRCDSNVVKDQIGVDEQTLWDDLRPLMVLKDFESSEPQSKSADTLKFWDANTLQERLGPVAYQILRASELENDLTLYLTDWSYKNRGTSSLGAVVCTSLSPEIQIPVYSWILSARSSVLRDALAQCRRVGGTFELPDLFSIKTEETDSGLMAVVTFSDMDMLSLLNFVLYCYEDKVIPVWNYTRQAPPLAYRYRQVRAEVMKAATRLNMPKLETAVRTQTDPKRSMHEDFQLAIQDNRFFEDGDAILELKGAEVPIHSVLLCQRCPWFQGLFHGRSGGGWLANRRQALNAANDKIRLDLKHMDPKAFQYVLRHVYADVGAELFDSMVLPDLESFFKSVLEVLNIANELMLDRLAQICQLVIGQFANTRNISHLLNTISMCAVSEFKDAGLEYICLQMEMLLENHLLDDLDEDLFQDLDAVVRDNQLTQMPFAKSGRDELELHQKYPELAQDIDEERQRRVREMAFKYAHRDDDRRAVSSSFKSRIGSLDDMSAATPSPNADRNRRKSRSGKKEPLSPPLRPKASQADLIFNMEDEDGVGLDGDTAADTRPGSSLEATPSPAAGAYEDLEDDTATGSVKEDALFGTSQSPAPRPAIVNDSLPTTSRFLLPTTPVRHPAGRSFVRLSPAAAKAATTTAPSTIASQAEQSTTPKADNGGNPWGSPATSANSKMDLRTIMTESTPHPQTDRTSALSAGLDAQRGVEVALSPKIGAPKMSQKERKKQQQHQQQTQIASANMAKGPAWDTSQTPSEAKRPATLWQTAPSPGEGYLAPPSSSPGASGPSNANAVGAPVDPKLGSYPKPAMKKPQHNPRAASPDTRFAGQPRPRAVARSPSSSQANPAAPLVPHSKVYIKPAPKTEQIPGLSMAEIFLQQQLEQESIKEAVSKRSLQEIQQEQAFQEWWDQESRRTQEEEARRQGRDKGREGRGRARRGGKADARADAKASGGGGSVGNGAARRGSGATAGNPSDPGGSGLSQRRREQRWPI